MEKNIKQVIDFRKKVDMIEDMKHCLNCGKPIPKVKYDSLGRKNTRTSNYCNNNKLCRNAYIRNHNRKKYKKYMAKYYLDHPEKFR